MAEEKKENPIVIRTQVDEKDIPDIAMAFNTDTELYLYTVCIVLLAAFAPINISLFLSVVLLGMELADRWLIFTGRKKLLTKAMESGKDITTLTIEDGKLKYDGLICSGIYFPFFISSFKLVGDNYFLRITRRSGILVDKEEADKVKLLDLCSDSGMTVKEALDIRQICLWISAISILVMVVRIFAGV